MNTETKKPEESKEKEVTAPRPASSLLSFDEFDNFFDDFLSRRWPRLVDWNFSPVTSERGIPKVDIVDYPDRIEVQAALAGINKDDLEVTINNQSITIRASTKKETEEKKEEGKYFRQEIMRGEFQRTLSLPDNVDSENASAAFKDGILTITMPKTEKSKRKTVDIT
jgi:HSP20 family protein